MSKSGAIEFIVNGELVRVEGKEDMTLLQFLREELGLMGTKNGCAKGHCGACTVIVDGMAQRACLLKIGKLLGKQVETIENLSRGGKLHPIQVAFLKAGAVQCGYCTPGMIMAAKALLDRNNHPSVEEIQEALKHNLCRCTGYVKIVEAVKLAGAILRGEESLAFPTEEDSHQVVGVSVLRKDAVAKVKGEPIYAGDLRAENMLYGKLVFSSLPHARILKIDTSRARAHPGVVAVLTHEDIPGRKTFGLILQHQPVLAFDKVRFVGEPVALILAETEEAASAAAEKVLVDYEPLPGVFSPEEALREEAPLLHEGGNLLTHVKVRKGDTIAGFAESEVIIEGEYFTPFIEHAYLEPEAALALPEPDGLIHVFTPSQSSFSYRDQIAATLNLPKEKVRVSLVATGGAFGGREEPTVQIHCALGAWKTGRPVKMVLTREESIRMSTKRHAAYMRYKTGARKDGKLQAVEIQIYLDTGAYASVGGPVAVRAASFSAGPYDIPHAKVDVYAVYTNNPPAGAMRGFGSPQVTFASEQQMDRLARELNMDPITLREINALEEGKATITGHVLEGGIGLKECLVAIREALAREALPLSRGSKKIGLGVAAAYKNVGLGTGRPEQAGAYFILQSDGTVDLRVGCVDSGQGIDTVVAQIAAEVTGIPYRKFKVLASDTHATPDAGVTTASRMVYLSGNAVLEGAALFKLRLLQAAGCVLKCEPEELILEGGCFRTQEGQMLLTLEELARQLASRGQAIRVEHTYTAPPTYPLPEHVELHPLDKEHYRLHYAYCFGVHAAVVEADETSGEVRVLKYWAAHDVGRAIHKQNIEGQMEGGIIMGLGYALKEEFKVNRGWPVTDNLAKLRLPRVQDVPDVLQCFIIEKPDPWGPLGAKGMGELPVSPVAPAICNALYDALGVRVTRLPATPQVLKSLLSQK